MITPTHGRTRPINLALVNNMPDGAFVDTEHQFLRAAKADDTSAEVTVSLYTMPGLARSEAVTAEIRSRYQGLDDLWGTNPDAMIVTGTEPVQAELHYEPYWPHLAQLLRWAEANVPTTLLSCLAAHASLLMFDGLRRSPLSAKCSGVFKGSVDHSASPLANRLPATVPIPHSRVNDVPEGELAAAGYSIVIGSGEASSGWSVATRTQGNGTFVLCQGHLEYSTDSLLREYRRDVRRFLLGRGAVRYPPLPSGYLSPEAEAELTQFASRAVANSDEDLIDTYEQFPYERARSGITNTWTDSSATFYRNWLELATLPVATALGDQSQ